VRKKEMKEETSCTEATTTISITQKANAAPKWRKSHNKKNTEKQQV
ncbi:hypothetical protein A2U01_0045990, partial [Trifolium medium]|nr:hypothetical protein [Trifolium medium]